MTVEELKRLLDELPNNREVVFIDDADRHYKPTSSVKVLAYTVFFPIKS